MLLLSGVTNSPYQVLTVQIPEQPAATVKLYWLPTVSAWYFDLTWEDFTITGKRVVNAPNLLVQFENVLPFGIGCTVDDDTDPFDIDAFSSENAHLTVLSADDIDELNTIIYEDE